MQTDEAGPLTAATEAAPLAEPRPGQPTGGRRALTLALWPFWNGAERRLRALWRLAGFAAVLALLGLAARPLGRATAFGPPWTAFAFGLRALFGALMTAAAVWIAARLLERRPLGDFGLRPSRAFWADLGFGLFLGAFLMTLAFAVEYGAGWVRVEQVLQDDPSGLPFAVAFLAPALLFVSVGFYEELLSRGYLLRLLTEGLHFERVRPQVALIASLVLTSALFGLGHAKNPNATVVSSVNIAFAGAFLALPYLLTGRLALSIGLHIAWNLFQGPVYGFPVSGTTVRGAQVLVIRQGGPEAWTGGAFGPEGGLLCLALILVGSALIVGWVRWREGRLGWCVALALPPERTQPLAPALPAAPAAPAAA
jgi:membrane protease YdiL (CAAX protease family)